jgi:predicted transcriptional regulator
VPTKVNIVLDDDVKADLDRLVESGMRSRVVNRALRKEILAIRRQRASQRLDELRRTTTPVSTAELLAQIRRDRGRSR